MLTKRLAVYLIKASEMLQPKWFHEFQPIAGVFPNPLSKDNDPKIMREMKNIFIIILYVCIKL